eukprot:comp59200_c0_seq1/m.47844 comp59200_c0_seq1/g.47844  ORF comp59200_c0_seq1/g.47844 comp59200_c0_seq1/m.47844 type:complete len:481 (-) comp59200_c0_seq1:125-1567(-)
MTPSVAMLSSADAETQKLRLQAANGCSLLWVMFNHAKFDTVQQSLGRILTLGIRPVIVFDDTVSGRDRHEQCQQAGLLAAAQTIFADLSDGENAAENVLAAVSAANIEGLSGVFSPYEQAQVLVGELGERLGLPCNPKSAYLAARDKHKSRLICRAAGIPTPGAMRITSPEQLSTVEAELGFPVVLKPQTGAGSDGVYRCNTFAELQAAYTRAEGDREVAPELNWNPGCTDHVGMLVESYIDGDEFDVDLLFWDGECVYGNANDNWPTREPTFLETGSNSPSTYSAEIQKELVDYSVRCVKALGFRQGCFHVECKYTKGTQLRPDGTGQPMLIEVNSRMGGGATALFHKEVYGVSLFDNFVLTACGIPINPPCAETPLCAICEYSYCSPKTGVLTHTRFLDEVKSYPGVMFAEPLKKAGEKVKGYDTGIPEWVATIAVRKENVHDAINVMNEIVEKIDVPIVSEDEYKKEIEIASGIGGA